MGGGQFLGIAETATELGLIGSLTVLALFLSYTMLNVCDLSTDGCFTLGACTAAVVVLSGHPYLAILAAMAVGMISGFVTAFLQTKMGIDSLLAGIIVNTGLYSINIAIMGGGALLNMNKTKTVFSDMADLLKGTPLERASKIIVALIAVALVVVFQSFFLKTRLGLAIRATGDNPSMVRSSSVNTAVMTTVGLVISGSFTALSGCLLAQYQKSVNIDIGSGMVTVALASLLIGRAFVPRGRIPAKALGAVLGSVVFRVVYSVALRFNMPAFMLRLVSSVIVIVAIAGPYLKSKWPEYKRRLSARRM
ncbi:MAG: ABC transporter permease [Eubacterium sp.]|jgi:putative ABC transport system permease protein